MTMKPDQCPMCYYPYPSVLPARRRGGRERYECLQCGWRSDMQPPEPKEWGGAGRGQGNKHKWKSGETTTLRVPVVLKDEVLNYARLLDGGEQPAQQPSGFASISEVLTQFNRPVEKEIEPTSAQAADHSDEVKELSDQLQAARETIAQAAALLEESLKLVSNKGGAIKVEIRKALKLLAENQ